MTSFLDKLNLRPNERRLVVIVGVAVAAFLYYFLVWPQFGEWKRLSKRGDEARMALNRFEKEIAKTSEYQKELDALQRKAGQRVDTAAQDIDLQRNVYSIAAAHGVTPGVYTTVKSPSSGGKTNAWFEEQAGSIQFVAEETALVDFLNALSSGDSLIRVSSMTLSPDQPRQRLMATMTLVASYPRKAPAKVPVSGTAPPPAKAPVLAGGPRSISAAVAGAGQPAVPAAKPSGSLWSKVKNLFSSSKSTKAPAQAPGPGRIVAPAQAPGPGRIAAPTNAPGRVPVPVPRGFHTNAPPVRR